MKIVNHADTEIKYYQFYEELKIIANESFMQYYDKNWHTRAKMWTPWGRVLSSTFGVQTTNATESHNGQIKRVVNRSSTLVEVLRGLMLLYKNKDNLISYDLYRNQILKHYWSGVEDEDRIVLMDLVTPFAAKIIIAQKEKAMDLTLDKCEEFNTTVTSCQCISRKSLELPCAHMIYMCQQMNISIVDMNCIHIRWHLDYQDNPQNIQLAQRINVPDSEHEPEDLNLQPPPVPEYLKRSKNIRSTERKFADSMKLCKEICSIMQFLDEKDAQDWESVLEQLYCNITKNQMVAVLPITLSTGKY
jgi:hypothetical protein